MDCATAIAQAVAVARAAALDAMEAADIAEEEAPAAAAFLAAKQVSANPVPSLRTCIHGSHLAACSQAFAAGSAATAAANRAALEVERAIQAPDSSSDYDTGESNDDAPPLPAPAPAPVFRSGQAPVRVPATATFGFVPAAPPVPATATLASVPAAPPVPTPAAATAPPAAPPVEFSEEQVAEYKQAFKRFDADGSGSISTKEVSTALADLDLLKGRSEEEVRRMVAAVDVDGSGEVDFAEFLEMMQHSAGALSALVREEKALHEAALQVRVAGAGGRGGASNAATGGSQ